MRRQRILVVLLMCFIGVSGLLIFGVGPIRIDMPVRGQVIDSDTKRPIPGAAVRLDRTAACPRFFHGHDWHRLPSLETRTDGEGRFTIGGGVTIAPCMLPRWSVDLHILAVGYLSDSAHDTDLYINTEKPVRYGLFELDRIRYLTELEEYRSATLTRLAENAGPVWAEALNTAQRLSFRTVGRPGAFASQAGAIFDQIATVEGGGPQRLLRWIILAQDRNTGSLYRWTTKGTSEATLAPPVPGSSMLGGRRSVGYGFPFFVKEDWLYFPEHGNAILRNPGSQNWFSASSRFDGVKAVVDIGVHVVMVEAGGREVAIYHLGRVPRRRPDEPREGAPGPSLSVSDMLSGSQPPIECMTGVRGPSDEVVFIAHTADGRALFGLPYGRIQRKEWVAERVELPRGTLSAEVTACAGGNSSLYVALRNRGIIKLERTEVRGWKSTWKVRQTRTLTGASGPLNFSSLAVGEIEPYWEVLYGVAGDDAIYRFSADLRPDQRIEFSLSPSSPGRPAS